MPSIIIGRSAPSAVRPEDSRLSQMLKNARNRCQATPIVGCTEMVISQATEITILTAATTMIASFCELVVPVNRWPSQAVSG